MKSATLLALLAVASAIAQVLPPQQQQQPRIDPRTLGSIEGVTYGANHQPLPDTTVMMIGSARPMPGGGMFAPAYDTTSDSIGRFSFQAVAPGRYTFTANHADYSPYNMGAVSVFVETTATGSVGHPVPAAVTVAEGQHVTNVEIDLEPMTVLSGKVIDENGDPIPGVTVRPMQADSVLNGRVRLTNAGVGVKTGPDGKYQMSVYSGGWYLSFLPARIAPAKPEPAKPDPAQPAATTGPAKTEAPQHSFIPTYYPGVRDMSNASGLDAAGQPLPDLIVKLQQVPVFHLRGKIAGWGHGDANPDFRIVPSQETGSARPSIVDEGRQVQPDGTFELTDLTPGAWTLIVCQYGRLNSLGRQTIQVTDRDVENIVIPVQPPAELRGNVRIIPDEAADALLKTPPWKVPDLPAQGLVMLTSRELVVRLIPLDSMLSEADSAVQGDGAFDMKEVEAGRYRVEVNPPPGGFIKSVTLNGREAIDTGIDLRGGAASAGALQIVVSMTAGEIRGNVTNPDGDPPSAAVVTLVPDIQPTALYRADLRPVVNADATGHFVLKDIAPGTYRVYAWERLTPVSDRAPSGPPIVFTDPDFPRLFDSMSAFVTIGENESKEVSVPVISVAKIEAESRRNR